jgi:NAD(P)H-nitrite reductase large subunit
VSEDPPADGFVECHCTGVSRATVIAAIAAGCRTVEEIRRRTGACSGCGSCRPELTALLRAERERPTPPAADPGPGR